MIAFAADEYVHHTDQYGLIGDDCTVAHRCITAQLQAAKAARQEAAQAAAKAGAAAAQAEREAASLALTTKTNTD